MQYIFSPEQDMSKYVIDITLAISDAWRSHPAYNSSKIPQYQFSQEYLNNPGKTLLSKQLEFSDHLTKNPNVRKMEIFNTSKTFPFDLCRWLGDLPDVPFILEHEKTSGKPCVIAVNAVLSPEFKNKWAGKVYQLSAPWMSIYYNEVLTEFTDVAVEKDFACLINRLDPNRQSWFYLLIQRNLLNRGYVSFNLDNSRSNHDVKHLAPLDAFENLYQQYMTNFETEHNIAKHIVPYRNFPAEKNLDSILMKSRFNIILETYFSVNDQIMFTEKTIRSLRLPRPWLMFGAKSSVAQLRKWGFDVLDEFVDHSRYDNIEDPIVRQSVILDIAQELCNFDTVKNWDRLRMAALTNNRILLRWKNALPQIAFDDFYKIFDDYAIRNNLSAK